MEQLTLDRQIIKVESLQEVDFANSYVLWVIHADKIPPHIGISAENRFFSLKSNGKDENLKIDRIESVLRKKSIPVLLYSIKKEAVTEAPTDVFSKYQKTISGKITCLEPLKAIFDDKQATIVKELLRNLESKDLIMDCFGWQLPTGFVEIPDYDITDIHQRLINLEHES